MDTMGEKYFLTRGKAILFGLILIAVIVLAIIFKIKSDNSTEKYKEFEKEIKSAAENYFIIKNVKIDKGEEVRVSKKTLQANNLIYNELKDKCDGYAIISNEKNFGTDQFELTFTGYIKCGNKYISSGYSEY